MSLRVLIEDLETVLEKKPKLGSGERFAALAKDIEKKSKKKRTKGKRKGKKYPLKDPAAVAAAVGRKVHGKAAFQKLAAAGRRRAAKAKKNG